MNYLAHALLSGQDEGLLIGNLIADQVKWDINKLPENIKKGVLLHRKIDVFTDSHTIFLDSVKRIRHNHRHFSPVIMDVFYDFFLANNFNNYYNSDLESFVDWVGQMAGNNRQSLPLAWQNERFNMNWLLTYRSTSGVRQALNRIANRTKQTLDVELAMDDLHKLLDNLKADFDVFFPQVMVFVDDEIERL